MLGQGLTVICKVILQPCAQTLVSYLVPYIFQWVGPYLICKIILRIFFNFYRKLNELLIIKSMG